MTLEQTFEIKASCTPYTSLNLHYAKLCRYGLRAGFYKESCPLLNYLFLNNAFKNVLYPFGPAKIAARVPSIPTAKANPILAKIVLKYRIIVICPPSLYISWKLLIL